MYLWLHDCSQFLCGNESMKLQMERTENARTCGGLAGNRELLLHLLQERAQQRIDGLPLLLRRQVLHAQQQPRRLKCIQPVVARSRRRRALPLQPCWAVTLQPCSMVNLTGGSVPVEEGFKAAQRGRNSDKSTVPLKRLREGFYD